MASISQQLNDLYNLHQACQKLQHGVREGSGDWGLFWPSYFIYSYFTFNSIYTTDWSKSITENALSEWSTYIDGEERENSVGDAKRIRGLINFAYDVLDIEAPGLYMLYLRERVREIINPEAELLKINPDRYTSNLINGFREKFSLVLNDRSLTISNHRKSVQDLLYFVHLVRCNVFHGRKTTLQMMDSGQQTRLRIYAAIMESANELFFLAMERKIGWQKPVYPADRSSEGSLRARRRPRAITEAELSDHSLSRTFDITIPPGALFYPCCGSDTRDPLLMFLDSAVDEFHFVDARFIPPIPKIISQPTSSQYHPNHAPIHEVPFLRNQSLGTIFIPHQERQHDLNIQLLEGKKVKAICHCLDGFLSLKYKINNDLAVFYYRGDSAGEGGSGQWWLGHELFNEVLDRLVDGALIVTDGSNFYPNATDLPWSNLWQAGDLLNKGISGEDLSFVWRERSFRLLGQCGRRYGPVYAWQVSRLK